MGPAQRARLARLFLMPGLVRRLARVDTSLHRDAVLILSFVCRFSSTQVSPTFGANVGNVCNVWYTLVLMRNINREL